MNTLQRCFISLIYLSFLQLPAQAWEISIEQNDNQSPMVWVGNQQPQGIADVYLLWLDMDTDPRSQVALGNEAFQSWHVERGWQTGIQPVLEQAIDVIRFESMAITPLVPQCPTDHRCFLAALTLEPGSEALDLARWKDAAVLPLTVAAAYERLPAQTLFLNPEQARADFTSTTGTGDASLDAPSTAPAPSTENKSSEDDSGSTSSTEKPDIFRLLDNHQLLYVNGQAERLQLIDINDLSQPSLEASLALSATPKELYVLNDLYVLLQNKDYQNSELSVVKQTADGQLSLVDTQSIPGHLYESRRRNARIYSVASVNDTNSHAELQINVVQIDALGHLDSIDNQRIRGYDPKIAIFPDHLVIANRDPNTYPDSLVHIFALHDANTLFAPLVYLGAVRVPGYVPSEFHVDVRDQQLRVVYGPENRNTGSNLGIYDLIQPGLPLLGEVRNIAPGEALFATRFHQDKAYIVTFERTDPLWVIGLSDPRNPVILGELIVPGWSEKLFFHNDRLFAVGIDDQPNKEAGETERWYRRVAMSLFDVSDPLNPSLLDRITPLTGVVNYSYSPALDDERALLLNWEQNFAAVPVNHWYSRHFSSMNHLQLVDFSQDKFRDLGLLELSVPAQRSLLLGNDNIGVMADQRFITAQWSDTAQPQVLGELELARNLGWLDQQGDDLWSAGYGDGGYRSLYRYSPDNLELPAQRWTLAQNFYQITDTDSYALFYQDQPMTVQRFDYATQSLSKAQILEAQTQLDSGSRTAYDGYQRSELLADEAGFYLGEQRPIRLQTPRFNAGSGAKADVHYGTAWQLRTWLWDNGTAVEQPTRPIPGKPLALSQDGRLITVEHTRNGSRLEVMALRGIWTQVVQRLDLDCQINALQVQPEGFYGTCAADYGYYYPMLDNNAGVPPQTRLLHLVLDAQLRIAREWKIDGQRHLLAVNQGVIMLGADRYYAYPSRPDIAFESDFAPSVMPSPRAENACEVLALTGDLPLRAKLDTCPAAQNIVLLPNKAYMTQGFAGIQRIGW